MKTVSSPVDEEGLTSVARMIWSKRICAQAGQGRAAVSSGLGALTTNQEVGSFDHLKAEIKPGFFCILMQPRKRPCTTQEGKKGHKWSVP